MPTAMTLHDDSTQRQHVQWRIDRTRLPTPPNRRPTPDGHIQARLIRQEGFLATPFYDWQANFARLVAATQNDEAEASLNGWFKRIGG